MKAAPRVTVTVSGHVEEWPPGFTAALPAEDWLAVLALPRHDKLLCAALRHRALPGLMLFERRTRNYARKGVQEYLVPLIGPWAFVHTIDRDPVWATEQAVRVLPIRRPDIFVRELSDLMALLRTGGAPPVVNPHLVPGTRVRILHGAMSGLCGIIARRRGHARLVVNFTAMGTSVSTELPADAVAEPIAEEAAAIDGGAT